MRIIINIFHSIMIIIVTQTHLYGNTIIPRKLLIAYQSQTGQKENVNTYFDICQTITDYYGLLSDYIDVNTLSFPKDQDMKRYRAIITAFNSNQIKKGIPWLKWLKHQCDNGIKLIILGPLSGNDLKKSNEYKKLIDDIFMYLGIQYKGMYSSHQGRLRYQFKDSQGVEFERPYPVFPKSYELFKVIDPNVKVWLSMKRNDLKNSESTVIATCPNGGFARYSEMFWMDLVSYKKKWYINPFKFFEEALGIKNLPRLDPTTLNGLRVAFSHIDGDAFSGPSRINHKKTCAEIIRDDVLKKYNYPVTASVIVAEISPEAAGSTQMVNLAKDIFALPNIEPASHAFSHPFYWNANSGAKNRYPSQYGILVKGYTFNSEKEIVFSMNYISQHLSPPDKPCKVMLWSGACDPTEKDLIYCKINNSYNMNGGDTVFDNANDSYTAVAPLYRKVGSTYQIHCGQANENILTNLWEGPYYGFQEIIETMKRTGSPKRIKPIDIYYHFYSGEYQSSLEALQNVYEWVLKQNVALVYTSQYIKMMQGYLQAEIFRNDQGHFLIKNYHHCLTVRFDHMSGLPDLRHSKNVTGFSQQPQGLYVSLKPNTSEATIAFLSASDITQNIPYIESATGWVMKSNVSGNSILIEFQGFGSGTIQMAGLKKRHQYTVNQKHQVTTDSKGKVKIQL